MTDRTIRREEYKPTSEYIVVSFLGNRIKPSFRRTEWPLHLTVLNSFLTELPPERLTDKLLIVAFKNTSLSVPAREKAMYGRKNDVSATVLELTDGLKQLHYDLLDTFKHDVEFKAVHFNGATYSPHVSDQRSGSIHGGDVVPLRTLSLIQLSGKVGRVLSTVPLS